MWPCDRAGGHAGDGRGTHGLPGRRMRWAVSLRLRGHILQRVLPGEARTCARAPRAARGLPCSARALQWWKMLPVRVCRPGRGLVAGEASRHRLNPLCALHWRCAVRAAAALLPPRVLPRRDAASGPRRVQLLLQQPRRLRRQHVQSHVDQRQGDAAAARCACAHACRDARAHGCSIPLCLRAAHDRYTACVCVSYICPTQEGVLPALPCHTGC